MAPKHHSFGSRRFWEKSAASVLVLKTITALICVL